MLKQMISLYVLTLVSVTGYSQQSAPVKDWLAGKWKFEKLAGSASPDKQEKDSLTRYNKLNTGLIFTFTLDEKATSFLPGIPE